MTLDELIAQLRSLDVELSLRGDKLRFNAPKGVLTPQWQQELAERKPEILAWLRQEQLKVSCNAAPLQPISRDGELPLSFAQERQWFLDRLEPGKPIYNVYKSFRLVGSLNVAALERSFKEIVIRHEVLRTTCSTVNGRPVQTISPELTLTLPIIDLRELPQAEREAEVHRLTIEEASQPFNLAEGPLLRVTLLWLSRQEYVLLLTTHHFVVDGWSMRILLREVSVLYKAFVSGEPSPLRELSIQYVDFACWQRQQMQGQLLETQLAYWKKQLAGAPSVIEIPTDRPRPAVQTYRGASYSLVLPLALSENLKTLSREKGVTLFMTLLAGFQTLLHRYTHQEDIIVATAVSNRSRVESEELIGSFANYLLMRTDFSGNPTFSELLHLVHQIAVEAYAHQHLPFEKIVEELDEQLFKVMFLFHNASKTQLELLDLTVNTVEITSLTSKFDLFVSFTETDRGLRGSWEYNTDLFSAETIKRMAGHFQNLLEAIVANPSHKVDQLPLLSAAELHQLLVEWNNTKADYPKDKCIHQLFEEQVAQTPDAIAVVFEDQQLTYRELNHRGNQLARYLQKLGVKPEVLVGICVDRSLEMVVGMLGILKAGGAYVPISPAYPPDRISLLLQDSLTPVLLTQQRLKLELGERKIQVVYLDTDTEVIAREYADNLNNAVSSSNLAYVIYTSGSTGKPKAVQIEHSSAVNLLSEIGKQVDINRQDTLLAVTTICFDIACLEIFLPLSLGALLVVVSREVAYNGTQLSKALNQFQATVMQATPVTWQLLLAAGWQGSERLKILCGGEALSPQLAERLLDKGAGVWNLYGSTETTIWSSSYKIASGERIIPIGRPVANTQFYILDSHLQPVPVGVVGELHIGGAGLARSYLNQPELTRQKFISTPFSASPLARLYKTGDLVRYRANGDIEHRGRIDNQVKIRGFRIELGEIEAVLAQHPGVKQAVVIVREDTPGERRLVAYIIPTGELVISTQELRGFLQQQLPNYMLPSAFVQLEDLPLTPNGKVFRPALPAPEQVRQEPQATFLVAHDELELQLKQIWEKVLGIQPIGIRENFFDLGGHSLLIVRLLAEIHKTLDCNLPLVTLFEAPTVEQQVKLLRQQGYFKPRSSLKLIQKGTSKFPLIFLPAVAGIQLARHLGSEQLVYGIQLPEPDEIDSGDMHIQNMAVLYVEQLRSVQPDGPYFLAGSCFEGVLAFEMAQQLEALGQKVALLTLIDTPCPNALYPRTPGITTAGYITTRFFHHLRIFLELNPMEKLSYIFRQFKSSKANFSRLKLEEARIHAMRSYKAQRYSGRTILFLASEEPVKFCPDPRLYWSEIATGELEMHFVPGDHLTVLQEPYVQVLASKLRSCLDEKSNKLGLTH